MSTQTAAPRQRRITAAGIGAAAVVVTILIALLSPWLTPYSAVATNADAALLGPTPAHWLGTDQYGRDVLTRTLEGGRYALLVAFLATSIAVTLGTLVGAVAAYADGWLDEAISRVLDAILSVPAVLALLLIVTVFGQGLWVIVLAVSIVYAPAVARVVRGAARPVVSSGYVAAARARGERALPIIGREILPNVLDTVLVEFAMRASWVVLLVSTLSFLGFGANPPTPDWGLMIQENRTALTVAPLGTVAPIVSLAVLVIGLNLAADGLAKRMGVDRAARAAA
ncbi:ABC transporter permease [Sediminivirga luteola]|uniref:ABC transporter permease n=1 Tax=Sediminivirga luteola TaxID=1774748 RepID=A0A8J2TVK1_9MICO|nr:ABC transporter permease [Sediminivirga luteola]MCI2265286.1 ABC transporter permease [Sediminivirga luteola]GGA04617.1 ABC transporter permease [Sediminivirga luteola]